MPIIITPSTTPTITGALFVGLESTFTFNGVVLNDTSEDSKYRLTQIGGLHTADIRDARENRPARDGETALHSFYAGRTITLQGRIESLHDHLHGLRLMEYDLSKAVAPLEESTLYIECGLLGGFDTQINCRQSQPLALAEEIKNYNQYRDFMITLRASDPRIVSQDVETDTWEATESTHAGVILEQINYGNYYADLLIDLKGPMTTPSISCGGRTFTISGSIPSGHTWTLDTAAGTISNQIGTNMFNSVSLASQFPLHFPGNNNVALTSTGMTVGNSQVIVSYRHSWL